MNWKRLICSAMLLLGLGMTFQSCVKQLEGNSILGKWEIDRTEFTTASGETISQKWDNRMFLTFESTRATYELMALDGVTPSTSFTFGYMIEGDILYYNNPVLALSWEGEAVQIQQLTPTEMRLVYRAESTPWTETINAGKPEEVTTQVRRIVDVYVRK